MGGILLTAATVPQIVTLARTRAVASFSWGFVSLNAVGILLLAWRSAEIQEWAFLALNLFTAGFWVFVGALKARAFQRARHNGQRPTHAVTPHAEG